MYLALLDSLATYSREENRGGRVEREGAEREREQGYSMNTQASHILATSAP